MPLQRLALVLFALPNRVDAVLAKDQRQITRDMLKAIEIAPERFVVVQVDVRAVEVEIAREEKFRRRVVRVGDEAVGRLLFRGLDERLDEPLHATRAVEADDVLWDLVSDADREGAGMTAELACDAAD